MGRRLDIDQLVGAAEIAERLGLKTRQSIHVWRQRYPDFPEPVLKLSMGNVWNWPDVERWAKKTGRMPERAEA